MITMLLQPHQFTRLLKKWILKGEFAMTGDLDRVNKLLEKGHSPNSEDKSGYRPLHYAARSGNVEVCATLLASGAEVDATTRAGLSTPLQRAALAGQVKVVEVLLGGGGDPRKRDADGRTALHRAVEGGSGGAVASLLRAAPEMASRPDHHGTTPAQLVQRHHPDLSPLFPPDPQQ